MCVFSPLCKCLLKLPASRDANWHWLHLFVFSPIWVFICLLKALWSQQSRRLSRHNGIVCIDLTFLHCVLSNVSSNGLPVRMQNHTGCICLTFLHCAFSNVSQNGLPVRMQKHTGCICLTFLHCAFSNVSSNCLPERMHSHIGWICLTCLHSVFLNVSSMYLDQRRHNRIGCIVLPFPHCAFSSALWLHLSVRLQMRSKISWIRNERSHCSHLWKCSLLCVFRCSLEWYACKTAYSHCCFQTSNYKHSWEAK